MTKPTIVTRAGKGSALTWTEGDSNLTNLRDATITVKAGTGGTDVVSDLNGTVTLVAGSNITITGDNTAKTVTIAAAGGSLALDDLTDVQATSPSPGDTLVWNNASSVWQAQAPSGGSMALDDLTDVNVMGASNGQVLTYNNSLVRWEASTPSTGPTTLDGLNDVVITSAATNDALVFNGTNWVDTALSGVTVGTASVGSTVTLTADNTTNATNYPLFASAATGNLSPRTDTEFTYNPSTGNLTSTTFSGDIDITGKQIYTTGTNANIVLAPTATGGQVLAYGPTFKVGTGTASTISSYGSGALTVSTSAALSLTSATDVILTATSGAVKSVSPVQLNAAGELRFADSDSSNYVGFKSPATVSANKIWTLPAADGTSGQMLSTNGSGTLSWATASGGGSSVALITIGSATATTITASTLFRVGLTESFDPGNICSITTNQITLAAGTYMVEVTGQISNTSALNTTCAAYVYNETSGANLNSNNILSRFYQTGSSNYYSVYTKFNFTLAGSTNISLRYSDTQGYGYISFSNCVMTLTKTA